MGNKQKQRQKQKPAEEIPKVEKERELTDYELKA